MKDQLSELAAGVSLESVLSRQGPLAATTALTILRALTQQIAQRHAAGELQRRFDRSAIRFSDDSTPQLPEPPAEPWPCIADGPRPAEFPSSFDEPLPRDMTAAAQLFTRAGATTDPRRIDLFLLGSLLCEMVSGHTVSEYLRSPRVVAGVPNFVRTVIDGALGFDPKTAIADADGLLSLIEAALQQYARDMPETLVDAHLRDAPAGNNKTADTTVPPHDTHVTSRPEAASPEGHETRSLPPRLGHYEIKERIGQGGMGDVYKAFEPDLNRTVAIKVLPEDLARHDDFVRRFFAEASAVAQLVHPNIIQIHYIGADQGFFYFAMQFVAGESLAEIIRRRGSLKVKQALPVIRQALAGLAEAHRKGLVHRDIKPGNVLIDHKRKQVILADFGLVKSLGDAGSNTATGVVMGTVDYISPEQGRGHTVDARSDLYSIGVMLFQMLTGRLPFAADSPTAMIFQHVYEQPPLLSDVDNNLPPALVEIVDKLLQKSPHDRYQSADEVIADLEAFQQGTYVARGAAGASKSRRSSRADKSRRSGRSESPSRVVLAPPLEDDPPIPDDLTDEDAGNGWDRLRRRVGELFHRHAPQAVKHLQNTQQQIDGALIVYKRRYGVLSKLIAEAESVRAELASYADDLRQAAERHGKQAAQATSETVKQAAAKALSKAKRQADELEQQLAEQDGELDAMRLRHAQARAKYRQLRSQRDILIARLQTAQAQLTMSRSGKGSVRRSNGRQRLWVAIACLGVLAIGSAAAYVLRTRESATAAATTTPPLRPVVSRTSKQDERSELLLAEWKTEQGPITQLLFLNGGREFLAMEGRRVIRLWNTRTARSKYRLPVLPADTLLSNSFSGDNKRFLTTSFKSKRIDLWDTETGKKLLTFTHPREVVEAAISPDGTRVISAGYDDVRMWDASTGQEIMHGDTRSAYAVAYSHRGDLAASGGVDQTVYLWDGSTGAAVRRFPGHTGQIYSLAFSDNDRTLLAGTNDGKLFLWDVATGKQLQIYTTGPGATRQPSLIGDIVAAVNDAGRRFLWDVSSGHTIYSDELDLPMALAANGDFFITPDRGRQYLKVMRIDSSAPRTLTQLRDPDLNFSSVAVSPVGNTAVTGSSDGTLRIWQIPPYEPPRRRRPGNHQRPAGGPSPSSETGDDFTQHTAAITALAVLPGNRRVLSADLQGNLHLWEAETKKSLRHWKLNGPLHDVAIAADGNRAAAATAAGIAVWDFSGDSTTVHENDKAKQATRLVFAADGQRVYFAGGEGIVGELNATSGEVRRHLNLGDTEPSAIALHDDGRHLAVAVDDRTVRIIDLDAFETGHTLRGGPQRIDRLQFSLDGRELLAAGNDNVLRMWDVDDGVMIRRYFGHRGGIFDTAFSADGRFVISASADHTLRKWDRESTDEIALSTLPATMAAPVALSSDGQFILTVPRPPKGSGNNSGSSSRITVWPLSFSANAGFGHLRVTAHIDGQDELRVFTSHLQWMHRKNAWPQQLSANGIAWSPEQQAELKAPPITELLSQAGSFENATMVIHQGRGNVSFRKAPDWVIVNFKDPQGGAGLYDITIRFPITADTDSSAATSPASVSEPENN